MALSYNCSNIQTEYEAEYGNQDDAKFCTALENMRYRNCTPNDIAFLRTCIVGPGSNGLKVAEKQL